MQNLPLQFSETVIFALRSLYNRYGYSQYRMGKFEEYDLYSRNKDFLISDSVLTFMDQGGRLMALKPDVTLSIVKNSKDAPGVRKLYYNENVYRVAKGSRSFREMMQVGLEVLGDVDDYCISEVLTLAAESLAVISSDSVLNVSHMGLLSDVLTLAGVSDDAREPVLKAIGEKNLHGLENICREQDLAEENIRLLKEVVSCCGAAETVLPRLRQLLEGRLDTEALTQLENVLGALTNAGLTTQLRFDFSVVSNSRYYNGIVFKGYVAGASSAVLSGGQYDSLMKRLHRLSSAIGFAVYMDVVEQLPQERRAFDVDAVLLYDGDTALADIRRRVEELNRQGISVLAQKTVPENINYKRLLKIQGEGVVILENNA